MFFDPHSQTYESSKSREILAKMELIEMREWKLHNTDLILNSFYIEEDVYIYLKKRLSTLNMAILFVWPHTILRLIRLYYKTIQQFYQYIDETYLVFFSHTNDCVNVGSYFILIWELIMNIIK